MEKLTPHAHTNIWRDKLYKNYYLSDFQVCRPGEIGFAPMKYALHFIGQAFHRAPVTGSTLRSDRQIRPAWRDLRFATTSLEHSEIPFRGGRCRFAIIAYAERHLTQFEDPALSKIPLAGRGDAVILRRRIKIGNPVGFQILEIQNGRIP